MDFLSLLNSRGESFFHLLSRSFLTALADSRRPPDLETEYGLIFSPRVIKAASVASPTFSKMFLKSLKSRAESLHMMEIVVLTLFFFCDVHHFNMHLIQSLLHKSTSTSFD